MCWAKLEGGEQLKQLFFNSFYLNIFIYYHRNIDLKFEIFFSFM
jgi:hypothetical protein